jgi:hypothetical protein
MDKNIIKSAVSLLLLFGLAQSGAAQIGKVIDRTTQRIENKVTNNVNTKIDRGVDKTVDKVLNPSKSKPSTTTTTPSKTTTTTSPSTTTTTPSSNKTKIETNSNSGISSALDNNAESSFVGTFQWEVKRYKGDKLVANGHTILNFSVKEYDVAVHILAAGGATNKGETGYVLNRRKNTLVTINETDGTATHSEGKLQVAPILNIIPMMETKIVDGVSCAKYMGENADIAVTLWVDETERAALASCMKNGIGVLRAEFELLPFLANMKTPVRQAILERKKTGEKTQMWLNQYSKTNPDEKAFDYSRYLQK